MKKVLKVGGIVVAVVSALLVAVVAVFACMDDDFIDNV